MTSDYVYFCGVCKKEMFEDEAVCNDCKTSEFILFWGNPFFDEREMSLEITGCEPYHIQYLKIKKSP